VKHLDATGHARGTAPFVDDIPEPAGVLHGAVVPSPVAHGRLKKIDATRALQCEGVVAVLTASDIPGENQIGGIVPDEPLLVEVVVDFIGQPVALVVAESTARVRQRSHSRSTSYLRSSIPAWLQPPDS
jgi:xanthine dehydrogenase large subunit